MLTRRQTPVTQVISDTGRPKATTVGVHDGDRSVVHQWAVFLVVTHRPCGIGPELDSTATGLCDALHPSAIGQAIFWPATRPLTGAMRRAQGYLRDPRDRSECSTLACCVMATRQMQTRWSGLAGAPTLIIAVTCRVVDCDDATFDRQAPRGGNVSCIETARGAPLSRRCRHQLSRRLHGMLGAPEMP